jgi:hypothetical protein
MQMTATVRAILDETRILVSDETGDRLLARLPALHASYRWALRRLLESLALWGSAGCVLFCIRTTRTTGGEFATDGLHLDIVRPPRGPPRARKTSDGTLQLRTGAPSAPPCWRMMGPLQPDPEGDTRAR